MLGSVIRAAERGDAARELLANNAAQGSRGATLRFYVPRAAGAGAAAAGAAGAAAAAQQQQQPRSQPRQRHAALTHIFARAVTVACFAALVALQEQELARAFIGVDFRRQRGGVGKFQRHMAFPAGFERGDVHDDPAASVRALPDAQHQSVSRDPEVFHCTRKRTDPILSSWRRVRNSRYSMRWNGRGSCHSCLTRGSIIRTSWKRSDDY